MLLTTSALQGATPPTTSLRINQGRLLQNIRELAKTGATEFGGVSRPAYSDADLTAREHVRGLMRDAGLDVRIDAGGNTFGIRRSEIEAGSIIIGSHTDTVPDGGRFDGSLGTLAAIEVAQTVAEHGIVLRHPLEVVDFQNEEGGLIGSKIVAGRFDTGALSLVAASGFTIAQGIDRLGGNANRLEAAKRSIGSVAAYVELHIEQGRILERARDHIGIVEGIVGIRYWEVVIDGVASHAGTTPMADRHDALLTAARFVNAVNVIVTSRPGRHVGTVGRLSVFPGGANVVPGRAVLTLELRDLDLSVVETLFVAIKTEGERIASETGTLITLTPTLSSEPSLTNPHIREAIASASASLGLRSQSMVSGAGHDAQNMATLGPAGMLFVPSVNGISHSPHELTLDEDIVNGANVLLQTVLRLDQT